MITSKRNKKKRKGSFNLLNLIWELLKNVSQKKDYSACM